MQLHVSFLGLEHIFEKNQNVGSLNFSISGLTQNLGTCEDKRLAFFFFCPLNTGIGFAILYLVIWSQNVCPDFEVLFIVDTLT